MDSHPSGPADQPPLAAPAPVAPPRRGGPLSGPGGLLLSLILLGAAGFLGYRTFYMAEPDELKPTVRKFVCSETGKAFDHALRVGDSPPVISPFTNKRTGFPAEPCFWTPDGQQKKEPVSWVILNAYLNKEGETKCPDCGRPVVPHNAEQAQRRRPAQASTAPAGPAAESEGAGR